MKLLNIIKDLDYYYVNRDQFTNEVISLLEGEAIIEDVDENRDSINA